MLSEKKLKELLFPYSKVRNVQDKLILRIDEAIENKRNIIVHAPTGLGKSAAALAPALKHAIKNKLTIFFLTSRHTQHKIAIDTLKEIKTKYNLDFYAVDIIGKKWMCGQGGVDALYSIEFIEYCKAMKADRKCEFFENTKNKTKLSVVAKKVIDELNNEIMPVEKLIETCIKEKLCPYEIALSLAKDSRVIIADYFYLINPNIRDNFFSRTNKSLPESIIIVDEGHNVPKRARELLTNKLSNFILKRAITEAKKLGYLETIENLVLIQNALNKLSSYLKPGDEMLIEKEQFLSLIKKEIDYDQLIADLEFIGDAIRETQKLSYIGSIAAFLEAWLGSDTGFARILSSVETRYGLLTTLSYRCLDPSIVTKDIFENSYSTIMMSGTLSPTEMYKEVLGFNEATITEEYKNPFPKKNRLSLIIPKTSTKFTLRNEAQFKDIAQICADIVNIVPGNTVIFFPSYNLRNSVNRYFSPLCKKTTFLENTKFNKQEKEDMLDRFKEYKNEGAVLLGVASGSFGEGIDLPGDLLKCVVVVGIPLQKPDLETKELIKYYEQKFRKGWDYGYVMPAITRSLQNAGRCIRSEDDKGAIIFLDQRYAWPHYKRCFPIDWEISMSLNYVDELKSFFVNSHL